MVGYRIGSRVWLLCTCLLILVACGGNDSNNSLEATETQIIPTPTQIGVDQPTPQPSDEAPPPEMATLRVWWPDTLAPVGNETVTQLLNRQFRDFEAFIEQAEDGNLEIDFRRKTISDVGGIMSTLRAARSVAPNALPDVTIVRRADLLTAVNEGLVQPLTGVASPSPIVISDLYDVGLSLGQVNNDLYGLAYLLDVTHFTYLVDDETTPTTIMNWSFADVLTRETPFLFPALRANGVNSTFMSQYLANGGVIPTQDNNYAVRENVLLDTLQFYEQAAQATLIDNSVFNYVTSADYLELLSANEITQAIITSDRYFSLRLLNQEWNVAPIPTENGGNVALANGWMWVVVTSDPSRQALAIEFINWMMDASRQREYAEVIYRLPSQESALLNFDHTLLDVSIMDNLLNGAIIILPDNVGGTIARAMQDALIAVINGESTAEEATQAVLNLAASQRDD